VLLAARNEQHVRDPPFETSSKARSSIRRLTERIKLTRVSSLTERERNAATIVTDLFSTSALSRTLSQSQLTRCHPLLRVAGNHEREGISIVIDVPPSAVESDPVIVRVQNCIVDGELVGYSSQEFLIGSQGLMPSRIQLSNFRAYIAVPTE
jgi:hypothetical protein